MKTTIKLLPILLTILLGSCTTTTTQNNTSSKEQSNELTLHNTWKLESMKGETFTKKEHGSVPELTVDITEKKFYGDDGCNQIFGSVANASDGNLKLGEIASTRMSCEDMETPKQYTELLEKARHYEMTATTLVLKDDANNTILTYSKVAK